RRRAFPPMSLFALANVPVLPRRLLRTRQAFGSPRSGFYDGGPPPVRSVRVPEGSRSTRRTVVPLLALRDLFQHACSDRGRIRALAHVAGEFHLSEPPATRQFCSVSDQRFRPMTHASRRFSPAQGRRGPGLLAFSPKLRPPPLGKRPSGLIDYSWSLNHRVIIRVICRDHCLGPKHGRSTERRTRALWRGRGHSLVARGDDLG